MRLDEDASVWFGAVLRGDNEPITIGARSNVQDLSVLHTDIGFPLTVGEDCVIGHNVTLHGCSIGDGTLIGMGAVILNGARIGKGCLVGARALITERKEFPRPFADRRRAGEGGQDARRRGAEDPAQGAAHYVENWRRYASGLKRIDGAA